MNHSVIGFMKFLLTLSFQYRERERESRMHLKWYSCENKMKNVEDMLPVFFYCDPRIWEDEWKRWVNEEMNGGEKEEEKEQNSAKIIINK